MKTSSSHTHAQATPQAKVPAPHHNQQTSVHQLHSRIGNRAITQKINPTQTTEDISVNQPHVNKTGIPDQLKAGLEQLSGFDLSSVRVHYNSLQPAKMEAHAFAQGTNIHLNSRQEQHLPHEAWHVIQQMQGRVVPTSSTGGLSINDDTLLEREADQMGTRALRANLDQNAGPAKVRQTRSINTSPIIQRKIWPTPSGGYYSDVTQKHYRNREEAIDAEVKAINDAEQLHTIDFSDEVLARWFQANITENSVSPAHIFNKQILNLSTEGLPENFFIMLRSYFQHTAGFAPIGGQGRDFKQQSKGGYYRSTDSPLKTGFRKTIKQAIIESRLTDMFRKTSLLLNDPLLQQLEAFGKISSNLSSMEQFELTRFPGTTIGVYRSSQGSHIGSLGLINNVLKMLRVEHRLSDQTTNQPSLQATGSELSDLLELTGSMTESFPSDLSYHDTLLANRGHVVREVSEWIHSDPWMRDIGVQAIQSGDHPSLIIYHRDYSDSKNEKEWRETFLAQFTEATKKLNLQTRLNYRGSFGFLFPTASSIGGPVRIWPGVAPTSVIKELLRLTLYQIDSILRQKHGVKIEEGAFDEMLQQTFQLDQATPLHIETLRAAVRYAETTFAAAQFRPTDPDVYYWVLKKLKKDLLAARFLLNSGFVSEVQTNQQDLEQHYLKAALVTENLMEYSYMLASLTRDQTAQSADVYPSYVSNTLPGRKGLILYFDSGMQAIIAANLLAKHAIKKESPSVLDIDSYFEYATINKSNLKLQPFQSERHGTPDIISADLNPVYTGLADPLHPRLDYTTKLEEFSSAREQPIPILDITNASLKRVPELTKDYDRFIVVESLTKHHQLGADKYTMGRLVATGPPEFLELAQKLLKPISDHAYDPLANIFRQDMDQVFYGAEASKTTQEYQSGVTLSNFEPMPLLGPWAKYGTEVQKQTEMLHLQNIQSLLHVNNCLINAVAQGAFGRNATLAELVEIRTQVEQRGFPIGSMLVAAPAILNIIRDVLGIRRRILVHYQGSRQLSDSVPTRTAPTDPLDRPGPTGFRPWLYHPIVIDHRHAHFTSRRILRASYRH